MKTEKMSWRKLLSKKRLCADGSEDKNSGRSPFQRDFDRIAFSSAFRRLQDKTQVHPLAESDYIRTRLTHSLETSCVARSLGSIVGKKIIAKHKLKNDYSDADFGAIVAAAALSHDIGNPPFGHSGEDAVKHWFATSELAKKLLRKLEKEQRQDFINFEGNAQGFRVITRLQRPDNDGGMQLTYATLAAFMKYPRISYIDKIKLPKEKNISLKKYGFFMTEYDLFSKVAGEVGLLPIIEDKAWCRHPLSFLVEAADDICYKIVDFEDGARLGHVEYATVEKLLLEIIPKNKRSIVRKRLKSSIKSEKDKIECLRSEVINELIKQVTQCFIKNEDAILSGEFKEELLKKIKAGSAVDKIYKFSKDEIYTARGVVEIESAGYEVLGGLLEIFLEAVNDVGNKPSPKSRKILQLLPDQFLKTKGNDTDDLYTRIIKITDFVSGMTDSFAVSTYKMIKGISLPHA